MWNGKIPGDDVNFYALLGIVQCGMWLQGDLERYLSAFGMSYGRFSVLLAILERRGKPVIANDLSIALGLSRPTVAKLVERLREGGLIERDRDAGDGRKKNFRITDSGKSLLDRVVPGYLERMRIIGSGLSPDEKERLIDTLGKINFLDKKKILSRFRERPISEKSREIRALCGRGAPEDIDAVMRYLDEDADLPTTKVVDYYLGTVDGLEGMKRIEWYLFNGTQIQRNYATLYFSRMNEWALVNKAYETGLIDYAQAYSK